MLNDFKKFILKGNVVDLSTGVIIGAAFTGIVTAFTKGIVEPMLALAGGGPTPKLTVPLMERMVEVKEMVAGKEVTKSVNKLIELDLGGIIGAVISFLITAAVVFFIIIKPMNKMLAMMKAKDAEAPPAPPEPTTTEKLLAEIRDSLKK
jgi:large conductance mechanosensitive channel